MAKPSDEIARERELIVRFRDLFQRLIVETERGRGSEELFNEVSVAAGEARRAYAVNDGRAFPVEDGLFVVSNADPMSHWTSVFDADSNVTVAKIATSLNLSIGRAQERLEQAKRAERGLIGVLSSILRWPTTLREAVGPSRTQRRAAQTLGIVGQVIVGAAAAALGAFVVQGAITVWGMAFG